MPSPSDSWIACSVGWDTCPIINVAQSGFIVLFWHSMHNEVECGGGPKSSKKSVRTYFFFFKFRHWMLEIYHGNLWNDLCKVEF